MTTPLPASSLPPPALTPAPALLQALADVGEVDLESGLGRRRLAAVIQPPAPPAEPRPRRWLRLAWLLAAAISVLLLALG